MKTTNIIVLVFAAVFLVALGINFAGSASIYTDFAYAKESGRQVHVVGKWVNRDQSIYDPTTDVFSFYLQDTLQQVQRVLYNDPKPMNFDQAEKVVIVGAYDQNKADFIADKIVMKCPSKYEETTLEAKK
ncbi:MAG: cytochrome c maturation protein CcmE [Bacteroidota bacterium]